MNRIVHISLKVDDVQRTGDFYHDVFGFLDSETRKTRDPLSRHIRDGDTDFTLEERFSGLLVSLMEGADFGPILERYASDLKHEAERNGAGPH